MVCYCWIYNISSVGISWSPPPPLVMVVMACLHLILRMMQLKIERSNLRKLQQDHHQQIHYMSMHTNFWGMLVKEGHLLHQFCHIPLNKRQVDLCMSNKKKPTQMPTIIEWRLEVNTQFQTIDRIKTKSTANSWNFQNIFLIFLNFKV